MKRKGIRPVLMAGVLIPLVCSLPACSAKKGGGSRNYEFTTVGRGTLEKTVSSSGSLKPVATVNVLPRMSGKVEQVYVDYNDLVKAGDVLAELNTDMLRLQREQQMTSVFKARANYELQQINFQNQVKLAEANLISEYEFKTSKTTLDIQAADLASAEANLRSIETEINQYAYIVAPIDGIVLERNINVGDTVVGGSNSNSSSMFTLAENLEEMQIEAGVGELDVASIRKGQAVRFTLESLPGRTFTGTVETLRLVPTVQGGVVSYTVIINVENREGSLLPGMTCAVEFIEERREGILLVPNAALRYQPTGLSADEIAEMVFNAGLRDMSDEQRQAAQEARAQARTAQESSRAPSAPSAGTGLAGLVAGGSGRGGMPPGMGGFPGGGTQGRTRESGQGSAAAAPVVMRNLWYINGEGKLDLLRVRAGISNGSSTEVEAAEDLEGMQIILREKI